MVKKPNDWENTTAFTGTFQSLPAGGYICKIIKVKAEEKNGRERLAIAFDIADGEYVDFFYKDFNSKKAKDADAKWPVGGMYYQYTTTQDGKCNGFFKGMIENIKASNPQFEWDWDETSLHGMLFGGLFGREEYIGNDGKSHWSTKCQKFLPVEGITEMAAPEDKPLNNGGLSQQNMTEEIPF